MRLDQILVERGLAVSRSQAQRLIDAGAVAINGQLARKAAQNAGERDAIELLHAQKFVSRGGEKLDYALDHFAIEVTGVNALDIGASTGGFCDCLLQRGAANVFCLDSGSNQLHVSLRAHPRVVYRESFNARHLQPEDMPFAVGLVVMDVSFISQTLLFPAVMRVLPTDGDFVSLVKPQFELSPGELGSGGIVRDEALRQKALDKVQESARQQGLAVQGLIESPIQGGDGNHEWLLWLR